MFENHYRYINHKNYYWKLTLESIPQVIYIYKKILILNEIKWLKAC